MIAQFETPGRSGARWMFRPLSDKGHVLVVEDEGHIRESIATVLQDEGYEVSFAENGRAALRHLNTETLPDIIVFDLKMPVMNGWEFRAIQKDDPRLGLIPVVAISADGSAQAAAISAQAYLRKPVGAKELLDTLEQVLIENKRQIAARLSETERLASLGRLAAGVGHEINNPLTFVMLNLTQALADLRPSLCRLEEASDQASDLLLAPEFELEQIKSRVGGVVQMLEDCQVGGDRIRETVSNLQRLSRNGEEHRAFVDVHMLIEQSVSIAWNQIRHRARLIKTLGRVPPIRGNGTAIGQVFLNLLINSAQAIPEGDAEGNEIRVSTRIEETDRGPELLVEISDSGTGMTPEIASHVFEPFFTTKPIGQGTGIGLSVSRQTVSDHGGRIMVESELGKGTVFRVFLPVAGSPESSRSITSVAGAPALSRGRILVIDDEPFIGRSIRTTLSEHNVLVVHRASEALGLLAQGETFDLVLCDVVMPDLSGPEFYQTVAERWPRLLERLVFMTGGAFTAGTLQFMDGARPRVLSKPFDVDGLRRLVCEHAQGNA